MTDVKKTPSKAGDIAMLTLVNRSGASVTLTSVGAGIVAVDVPDREGRLADVCLGYADPADYIGDGPASGKVPGRYANRIAKGHFTLDGVEYTLPVNNGPNCNHGGDEGFHNRNWTLVAADGCSATFEYRSADGEAGFPGNLVATAHYRWTDDNELLLSLQATTDKPTVVNLTNHAYWNLAGHDSGSVLDEVLWLNASRYLPTDETLIPSGELAPVAGTPMDFTEPKAIGRDIKADFPALKIGKGYDACWAVDGYEPGKLQVVARLADPVSGRVLEVESDQPGVQVYTGNWLSGCPANKAGRGYDDYDGVAIECQAFPDSPNKPQFPDTVLRPGETYTRHINFKFKTMKPTLYVLAAGMGSRYGGLKQLDGLGPHGETIMDYSIYDAIRAGFGKVVFVIRKDFEQDFREKILSKYEGHIPVEVVFQSVDKLPGGFTCPADRTKPWGPAHAVLMAKGVINEPFAVINADDFYGRDSFAVIAKELMRPRDRKGDYAMVGFRVGNTMTENGGVSRGVCNTKDGLLTSVVERKSIAYNPEHEIVFTDENGVEQKLDPMTPVSMNMWGFTPDYFDYAEREFIKFLERDIDTPKAEQVIPDVIDALIKSGEATVKVLDTDSRWFGVTYAEDRPGVVAKFAELHTNGEYPESLFK